MRLALLHTVTSLVGLFNDLCTDILTADVDVFHIADEVLLKVALDQGGLSPFIFRRVAEHAIAAEQVGSDALMLTCSSISPCVDIVQSMVSIPVLKVDEPMVDKAISLGERIGVAATVATTLRPTAELVRTRAALCGKEVVVDSTLCEGAYEALFAGDPDTHDRIVREMLRELMSRSDVVLLAQASMARVTKTIPTEEKIVPILTSPRLAVERARDVLRQIDQGGM